jgi:protein-L-isoaspartate(D-aspartate) O-methyltransferase
MQHLKDTFKHKGRRRQLIEELSQMGIQDARILAAFDVVPRHYFLDLAFDEQAYTNMAFQIGAGQTISHPYTVAFQTELLQLEKSMRVLEIGTGSGFQTSILCKLGGRVYSIERHHELHAKAKEMLAFLGLNASLFFGDGYKGNRVYAPYDRILVTCGAPDIPEVLLEQLKVGGLMVIPVGEGAEQKMLRIHKTSETTFTSEEFGTFKFVPMLERTVK